MYDIDYVFIADVFDQVIDLKKKTFQKLFYCKKFDGIRESSIKLPAKHPCLESLFKIKTSAKKSKNENLICNQRRPIWDNGMY